MQIFEVKFILEKIQADDRILDEIRDQIELARTAAGPSSPVLSDMPKSHTNNHRDLSDHYAKYEMLLKAENRVLAERDRHVKAAQALISKADSEATQVILEMYYIHGISRKDISVITGKKYKTVTKTISRGLEKIAAA